MVQRGVRWKIVIPIKEIIGQIPPTSARSGLPARVWMARPVGGVASACATVTVAGQPCAPAGCAHVGAGAARGVNIRINKGLRSQVSRLSASRHASVLDAQIGMWLRTGRSLEALPMLRRWGFNLRS
jgi:hypothetical protein